MTPVDSLAGTSWVAIRFKDRDLVPHSALRLSFESDTQLTGFDGCHHFRGPYTHDARSLRFSEAPVRTTAACRPALDDQADAYLAALSSIRGFRRGPDELQLLDAAGTAWLVFIAAERILAGTEWTVVRYASPDGELRDVLPGTTIRVAFQANARVVGNAGCNDFVAAYDYEAFAITIGTPRTTRQHCAEPAGIMDQERQFLSALRSAANIWFYGPKLELRSPLGPPVVSMGR